MLLVFNRTASPITLAGLSVVVPPSTVAPARGPAFNVTGELEGLSGGQYTALEAQRAAGGLDYLWTNNYAEFDVGTLMVEMKGPNPSYATQATWYVDPVGGDDNAAGTTALTAIKTFAERRRRIGGQVINQVTTTYVSNDVPDTDPMVIDDELGPLGQLLFVGTKPLTTLHTSLTGFTAVTATNTATNQQVEVTDSALTDDWGALGLLNVIDFDLELDTFTRIRITSGPRAGAIAYPVRDISAKNARCSEFKHPNTTFTTTPIELQIVDPVIADPYVVETGLTTIAALVCRVKVSATQDPTGFSSNPRVMFYNFDLLDGAGIRHSVELRGAVVGNITPKGGLVQFSACNMRSHTHPVTGTAVVFDHCKLGGLFSSPVPFGGPMITIAGLAVSQIQTFGYAQLGNKMLFELGGNLAVTGLCDMSNVGFFNVQGTAIIVLAGSHVRCQPVGEGGTNPYGKDNTTAVSLQAGARLSWLIAKPPITGTNECAISSHGSFPWTAFGDNFTCLTTGACYSKVN